MQWNSTDGGETFQVWFSQILSSLCGQRFAKFSIFCLLVPLQIRVGWDSFWQYFTNLCGGYLVFTFNHYQTVDLLLNLLFACPELEILEEAAFRYLLCTTLSFGLKIKQSVWPLHSKFFLISANIAVILSFCLLVTKTKASWPLHWKSGLSYICTFYHLLHGVSSNKGGGTAGKNCPSAL